MHKILRYPKFSETPKRSPTIFLLQRDGEFSTKNCDNPLLCISFFRYHKDSDTLKGCPHSFSTLRDKKKLTENRDNPRSLNHIFLSITKGFWNTKNSPTNNFRYCETKNFLGKIRIPLRLLKFFRYPKISETPKCSQTNFFGKLRQNYFDKKSW